jgi:8-oxo-dGTP diphosphatase
MSDPTASDLVRAAGVVVLRRQDSSTEVLLVHRPHRSDWSLPKGKVDPGEHLLETAVRECAEETGLNVTLGAPLSQQSYLALGRPKTVDYWIGVIREDEGFAPDEEIDEIRWVPVDRAASILTYAHDRELVNEALTIPDTSPLVILRHAKAMKRADFDGRVDAHRPLSGRGRTQSKALVPLLDAYGITAVHSSDSTRCTETVKRFAKTLEGKVELETSLSEEAHHESPKRTAKAIRRILESPEPTVICSHRPVMPTIMATLAEGLGLSMDDARLDPKMSPGAFVVIHRAFVDGAVRAVAIERHDAPLGDSEDHDLLP